jgi:uncharacterized protein YbjT (DUF2867 family)
MFMNLAQPILVIGGTRGTGQLIAQRLRGLGAPVRVLARDPGHALQGFPAPVEVVRGDLTEPATLLPALTGASHLVFTAGCRSGRPAGQARIRATEYQGVLNTLDAMRRTGFAGRFLYMTASGVARRSLAAVLLNLYKGNTLVWRLQAETAIRASGVAYTIIRAGVLLNRPGGKHGIQLTQAALPLSIRYRIARADVAEAFVAALDHPRTVRTTFEIAWGPENRGKPWPALLDQLAPDPPVLTPGA